MHLAGTPSVSVIVPAHNTEAFVGDAVRSALAQTVSDLEIVLVDDGSSDGTVHAAELAAADDPRLRVVRDPLPSGPSAARNRGMAAARGALFAFLDSDDVWLPRFLEVQLEALRACPSAAVVNGNAISVGGPLDGRPYRLPHPRRFVPLLTMIEQEGTLSIMTLMRREVFERIGGFDTALRRNEDYEFWLRAAVAGFEFVQTGEPLVRYRRRESGLSADELRMVDGIITVLVRARGWCAGRPREIAAIDRQIARFERESLALRGKTALRRGDFREARDCFRTLNARYPRLSHAAIALATRLAPRTLWFADRLRRSRRVAAGAALIAASLTLAAGPAASATVRVRAGDDLQRALDAARPGDILELEPGATFTGSFILPRKSDSTEVIVVRSATIPAGGRTSPEAAGGFARIRGNSGRPVIQTAPGAHHWRLELLDVSGSGAVELIALGDGSGAQSTQASIPHHLALDRMYVHGDARVGAKRCLALNGASTSVTNSYVSDCKAVGQDAQAIAGWNGPGPFTIVNNYLEGAGENVLFGGADPSLQGLVPSDIDIRDNLIAKPPSWRQERWQVKNLLELKNARRVTITGNILEYNWEAAQSGFAVLLTVRNQDGGCRWCQVEDVTFTDNLLRHVAAGIEILGVDDEHPSGQTRRIRIAHNVFTDVNPRSWGGSGYAFLLLGGPRDIVIDHNTLIHEDASGFLQVDGPPILGFEFTNNITLEGAYGVIGTDRAPGSDSIRSFFPGGLFSRNVIAGADGSRYPPGNLFPSAAQLRAQFVAFEAGNYRLVDGSAWRRAGSDGLDLGAAIRQRRPPRATDPEEARRD